MIGRPTRPYVTKPCELCGKEYGPGRTHRGYYRWDRWQNSRVCSRQCSVKAGTGKKWDRKHHYDSQFERQEGACGICGRTDAPLHKDHDHGTGAWRGLLCNFCNTRLPIVENEIHHQQAVRYLRYWRKAQQEPALTKIVRSWGEKG